jgi:hypothetical protein
VADTVAEDESESDEAPAKVSKCTGRRSEDWKILAEMEGPRATAQEALIEILQMQSETVGVAQHPYQRVKRVTRTAVLDHGKLWHCKHMQNYGATLTCLPV